MKHFLRLLPSSSTLGLKSLEHKRGSAKRWSPGMANFLTALAYHFCLAQPAAFTKPGDISKQIIALDLNRDPPKPPRSCPSQHIFNSPLGW